MRNHAALRGFSVIEVLATLVVLGMLLCAVGAALTHVLDAEMVGADRQSSTRSIDELGARMSEEARSATAVFIPTTDVLGQSNGGPAGAHEIDFFRKSSDGALNYVAYRYDDGTHDVTRFEYVPASGGDQIVNSDLIATDVGALSATRTEPSAIGSIVGSSSVKTFNVYYGSSQLEGGNGIVAVDLTSGLAGEPQRNLTVHLASRAAPTDISILVSTASPTPSPGPTSTPIIVQFVLRSPNPPPHGPNHQGDPNGGSWGPQIAGSAEFYGNGSGNTEAWFDISSEYSIVMNGTYSYKNSNGVVDTVTIYCSGGSCPPFIPMPVPTSGPS